jgi:hypothetical protein
MSKFVLAGLFSFGFLLAKIGGCFTSCSLCGRLGFFPGAPASEKTAD